MHVLCSKFLQSPVLGTEDDPKSKSDIDLIHKIPRSSGSTAEERDECGVGGVWREAGHCT